MKIGGRVVDGPKRVTLILPREEGDIPFEFVGVTDDSEFDKLFPEPEPPTTFNVKLQQNIKNYADPGYKAKMIARVRAKNAWVFLKSVAPSNIEWDTVKPDDPTTWENWPADLKAAGFNIHEVNTIYEYFARANMVTEEMLNEARGRFLASRETGLWAKPSSQATEPSSTASGVPANDSESAPPG